MRIVKILLVEDNVAEADLAREALEESKIENELFVVTNGEAAMDYLHKKERYSEAQRPDLILLDLNLPKKDGREVLTEIKNDDALKDIPVIILTTSKADEDVLMAYKNHANCYIRKPFDYEQFYTVIKKIEGFWFSTVLLPPKR